jgi:EAL and modified HD-GYP domain-containing signal transduction protein
MILACESLKTAGYRLALAGWAGKKEQLPLAAMADFLRVDIGKLADQKQRETMNGQSDGKTALIAEGVDSWEEHQQARSLGFCFFQGDFFLTPQLLRKREMTGTRRSAMLLLRAILNDPLDPGQIEAVVRDEPALSYKQLRYLNLRAMERRVPVHSIRMAISLIGEQEFRRWASVVAVVTPATGKTTELLRAGLTRAYFCEQLALRRDRAHAYNYFFTGLFSVLDAVLDRSLKEIVEELALSTELRGALLGEPGDLGDTLDAARTYEQGHWPCFQRAMERLSLPEACAPECFQAADRSMNGILN